MKVRPYSWASPLFSLVIFVVVHYAEKAKGSPLFTLSSTLMQPYTKQMPGAMDDENLDRSVQSAGDISVKSTTQMLR